MKKIILFLLTCSTSVLFSQIHELGFFVGGSNYIGDIGKTTYINPNNFSGGLIYKYNLNPRLALRGAFTYIDISADDKNSDNEFRNPRGYKFSNTIKEFAVGIEYNFFEYNTREIKTSHTPYILAEISYFYYKTIEEQSTTSAIFENNSSFSIPVGLGFKGRLADHLAYAIESGVRFTFVDDLDDTARGVVDSSYNGYGNDFYVFTGVSLVYTFGRPACYASRE